MKKNESSNGLRTGNIEDVVYDLIWSFSDVESEGPLQTDLLNGKDQLLRFIESSNPEPGLRNLVLEVCEVFHAYYLKERLVVRDLWVIQEVLRVVLLWSKNEDLLEQYEAKHGALVKIVQLKRIGKGTWYEG